MKIKRTTVYNPLKLDPEQIKLVSSESKIIDALKQDDCIGFYAYEEQNKIGFALLRKFEDAKFFLWDFIIDLQYQRCGKGKAFLELLIDVLKSDYSTEAITTTYIWGNEAAKKLYESFGFVQTDVVFEDDIHEVNMILSLQGK